MDGPASESRLTAANPMDNPYCSCKLTRVRSDRGRVRETHAPFPSRSRCRSAVLPKADAFARGAAAIAELIETERELDEYLEQVTVLDRCLSLIAHCLSLITHCLSLIAFPRSFH